MTEPEPSKRVVPLYVSIVGMFVAAILGAGIVSLLFPDEDVKTELQVSGEVVVQIEPATTTTQP